MQRVGIQWNTPVSRLIVTIAGTVILNRPWRGMGQWRGQIEKSSNAVMDWVADEPGSRELISALDEFSSGISEVVSAEDFISRCDSLQRSLGLEPMKREQLSALLALFVLREAQTEDELTASLGVFWKVMSEFDLSSLPDVVKGVMYMADLLAEGENTSTIRPRVRGLYEEDASEIAEFESDALFPVLNSPSWLLPALRSALPHQLCVNE